MALAAAVLAAGAWAQDITLNGATVTVETVRYRAEFAGLALTALHNKLTGETYAGAPAPDPAAADRAGRAGLALESLRPGVPVKVYAPGPRTAVQSERVPAGASVRFRGLHCGEEFDAGLRLTLDLQVDTATGDLLIRPQAHAEIEEVFGARDRGLLHAAVRVAGLDEGLRLVVPASDGFSVTRDNVASNWTWSARWPQFWEAALLIAEGAKGSVAIWADEPALRYGRTLGLARDGGWHATLAFETSDQIQRCTALTGAVWRLNVFDGNWLQPAARYREQMARQWPDLQPRKGRTPDWADRVRIFITGPTPDPATAEKFAALVPRDSLAVFTCQEWLRGWNEGDIQRLNKGMDYFPNWPLDNPTHYEARPDMPAKFAALEKLGIHLFPYTNPTIVTWGHPWLQKVGGARAYLGYRFWQRLYPELCADVVQRYGVSGIYEDCSWVVARNTQGEPDGDNWYNGSARMRQYFRQLLPAVALCGERNNEVAWRGQRFALSITQWPEHAHPIVTYLCEPYLRMWNLQLQPAGFDADDTRGWLTPWPFTFDENPIQERRILRQRGLVFAREQLASAWPVTWDPAVMHYFRSASGEEYRFVRDRGTRFVKQTPAGPETIYWRLSGVSAAEVGPMGIEGWVGYDGRQASGLNPRAVYPVFDGVRRPPVTLAGVPAGFHLTQCVVRDTYWVAALAADDPKAAPREATLTLRADGVTLKGVCGAKADAPAGPQTAVRLTLPGTLAAYWGAPVALSDSDELLQYPARNSVHRRDSGLIAQYGAAIKPGGSVNQACGSVEAGEEGSLAWLVTLPDFNLEGDDQLFLQFGYGSGHPHGDGANYQVRVNGRTVWKRYRPEQGRPDAAKGNEPAPVPLQRGQVNLKPWAGQTVVLELVSDGNRTSVSEVIAWHNPRLSAQPDHAAETDDGAPGPETGALAP
jgi:hypothetical protein